jgi:glycerol-3-phosphate dehydrogenase (NAD(P)+)
MTVRNAADVLVVGGGRMGTALGAVMARPGRRVALWARRRSVVDEINGARTNEQYLPGARLPDGLMATTDLDAAVAGAAIVVMALPSQSFREVARAVGDRLEGDQIVVHATKGFEVASFKRMSQILREETCTQKIGVLSGPTIADEIVAGHPSGALVASHFEEVVERTQRLFDGSSMRVYGGRDVVGTEVAGAFKNVVAVAAGAVDAMGFGDNTKWLLVTRGLYEMGKLGVAMGADVLTFGGLAGVGDLAATCASRLTISHRLGRSLVERREPVERLLAELPNAAEAVPTTAAIQRHADRLGLDLPIVRAVHGLLHEGRAVEACLEDLMSIPVGRELSALRIS